MPGGAAKVLVVVVPLALFGCGNYYCWGPCDAEGGGGGDEAGEYEDQTYFMAEVIDYSAPSACQGTSLNDVTSDFKATLDGSGWTGVRKADQATTLSDFYDQILAPIGYGKDHLNADNARVAVFAGHGHIGIHSWGLEDPIVDNCRVATNGYALGTYSGDKDSLFINAASCNGAVSKDLEDPMNCFRMTWPAAEFRQWLGFINSPHIDSWALTTFFQGLANDPQSSNGHVEGWLDVMEWPESGVHNYPVVYTKFNDLETQTGTDELIHYEMNMKTTRYMNDNPEPKYGLGMSPTVGSDQAELAELCAGGLVSC